MSTPRPVAAARIAQATASWRAVPRALQPPPDRIADAGSMLRIGQRLRLSAVSHSPSMPASRLAWIWRCAPPPHGGCGRDAARRAAEHHVVVERRPRASSTANERGRRSPPTPPTVVRANDRRVAPGVATADPALRARRHWRRHGPWRGIGRGQAMAAAADDHDVVGRLRLGRPPLRRPDIVAVQRLARQAGEGETHRSASGSSATRPTAAGLRGLPNRRRLRRSQGRFTPWRGAAAAPDGRVPIAAANTDSASPVFQYRREREQ